MKSEHRGLLAACFGDSENSLISTWKTQRVRARFVGHAGLPSRGVSFESCTCLRSFVSFAPKFETTHNPDLLFQNFVIKRKEETGLSPISWDSAYLYQPFLTGPENPMGRGSRTNKLLDPLPYTHSVGERLGVPNHYYHICNVELPWGLQKNCHSKYLVPATATS